MKAHTLSRRSSILLVLRSAHATATWSSAISKHGTVVRHIALIKTTPLRFSKRLQLLLPPRHTAIAFTSAKAVSCFVKKLPRTKTRDVWPIIAVVGPATAAAARAAGLKPNIAPKADSANAKTLANLLIRSLRKRHKPSVLFPCAKHTLPTLPKMLRSAGIAVQKLPIYQTIPNRAGILSLTKLLQKHTPKAAVFASPSAVKVVVTMLNKHDLRKFKTLVECIAIGPTTKQALRNAGFQRVWQTNPSPRCMQKTLKAALA